MKRTPKAVRRFLVWARRWIGTSKPTEWITAIGTVFGVAFLVILSGIFDAKRSEIEIKRVEINILKHKLEDDEKQMRAREAKFDDRVAKFEVNFARNEEISKVQQKIAAQINAVLDHMERTFVLPELQGTQIQFVRRITREDLDKEAIVDAKIIRITSDEVRRFEDRVQVTFDRTLSAEEIANGVTVPVKVGRKKSK